MSRITTALETALSARGIAVVNPWYFPTVEKYACLLTGRGFAIFTMERLPCLTVLPGNMKTRLVTFAQPYISTLLNSELETALDEVIEALRPVLLKPDGTWYADDVRLRVVARNP